MIFPRVWAYLHFPGDKLQSPGRVSEGCTSPRVLGLMMAKSHFGLVRGSEQPDPLVARMICSHTSYLFQILLCCSGSFDFWALLSLMGLWQWESHICPIWVRSQKQFCIKASHPTCHIYHLFSWIQPTLPKVHAHDRAIVNQHACFLPCNAQIEP